MSDPTAAERAAAPPNGDIPRSRRDVLVTGLKGGVLLTGALATSGLGAACSAPGAPTSSSSPVRSTTAAPPTPGDTVTPSTTPSSAPRTLLAYFSRAGENYYRGGRRDLEVGNTEIVARQIADLIDCDTYRIEAADPYSDDYDDTVARNVREEDDDARPGIANPLPTLGTYDNIVIGSPIWNVRTPMIMMTFAEGLDFSGKTVHPFVTYAVSGLGRAQRDYTAACPGADLRPGLAIQGEEAADHEDDVRSWLREGGLL